MHQGSIQYMLIQNKSTFFTLDIFWYSVMSSNSIWIFINLCNKRYKLVNNKKCDERCKKDLMGTQCVKIIYCLSETQCNAPVQIFDFKVLPVMIQDKKYCPLLIKDWINYRSSALIVFDFFSLLIWRTAVCVCQCLLVLERLSVWLSGGEELCAWNKDFQLQCHRQNHSDTGEKTPHLSLLSAHKPIDFVLCFGILQE